MRGLFFLREPRSDARLFYCVFPASAENFLV